MGFWDNVNDEFKKAVEEGWSAVKENARIGKLKYRAHTLRKEAQRHICEVGGIVYDSIKSGRADNPAERPDVTALIEKVKTLERDVDAIEEEIAKLKTKEASERRMP